MRMCSAIVAACGHHSKTIVAIAECRWHHGLVLKANTAWALSSVPRASTQLFHVGNAEVT